MNGNGKQMPVAGNQQQRFNTQYPFPPASSSPGSDSGFHVTAPSAGFAPAQGSAQSSQGPQSIRGMTPAAPPTPPQSDIKMQPQQQIPISGHGYVQQQGPAGRGAQGTYQTFRQQPPAQGGQRMPPRPQMFQPQMQMYSSQIGQMMFANAHMLPQQFQRQAAPPSYYPNVPYPQMMGSQHQIAYSPFSAQQPQTPAYFYSQGGPPLNIAPRTVPVGSSAPPQSAPVAVPQHQQSANQMQPIQMCLPDSVITQQQHVGNQNNSTFNKKRRPNAICIVDPKSGKDLLEEIYDENSTDQSADSSERQTPQPINPSGLVDSQVTDEYLNRIQDSATKDAEDGSKPSDIIAVAVTHQIETQINSTESIVNTEPKINIPNAKVISPDMQSYNTQGITNNLSINDMNMIKQEFNAMKIESVVEKLEFSKPEVSVSESNLHVQSREFVPENHGQRIPVVINKVVDPPTPVVSANTDGPSVDIKSNKMNKHIVQQMPGIDTMKSQAKKQPIKIESPPAPVLVAEVKTEMVKQQSIKEAQVKPKRNSESDKATAKTDTSAKKETTPVGKSTDKLNGPEVPVPIETSNSAKSSKKENQPKQVVTTNSNTAQVNSKEVPAAKPLQQKQPVPQTPAVVPTPQAPKPGNKTQKQKEINRKGAEKQANASDMDAFSTSVNAAETALPEVVPETVVAAIVPVAAPPAVPAPSSAAVPVVFEQNSTPVAVQIKEFNNPAVVKAKENKMAIPKASEGAKKVDVTSIVKQVEVIPKLPKREVSKADESDITLEEQIVKAKNEENLAKSEEVQSDNDGKSDLKYKYEDGQWSPANQEGKRKYGKDFLFSLQADPQSNVKPELPDMEVVLKSNQMANRQLSNRAGEQPNRAFVNVNRQQHDSLFPGFINKSQSQRGPQLTKRNSQQGKPNQKGGKGNLIHLSLSLRDDVKLHETENAWKPAHFKAGEINTEDDKKTDHLYKKVRGVLNKLTPEKFSTLVGQIKNLKIDNSERLQGVIELVFEKAIDEPSFSVAYALMCKELAMMRVPMNEPTAEDNSPPEFVNFRKLLITRCQQEFEKNKEDVLAKSVKLKEIGECTDSEKKKELQFLMDEEERRARVKSVGNVRFIGELFKQEMLTVKIMNSCLNLLLENTDEDSLECLCKLLTTIGSDLEFDKKQNLSGFIHTMQEIIDKKKGKVSSRVRFMLQDVIELRNNNWTPRRHDSTPKTMDQIQKEADNEQYKIQIMNSTPNNNTPRKDDRRGGNDRGKQPRNVTNEEGWSMAGGPRGNRQTPYQVDANKLRTIKLEEISMGKPQFGNWERGSDMKTNAPIHAANFYGVLDQINDDRRPNQNSRSGNKDGYHSKGPSMERTYKNYDDRSSGSRSGSQQRSRENSSSRGHTSLHTGGNRSQPLPPARSNQMPPPATIPQAQITIVRAELTDTEVDFIRKKMHAIIDEYANDCSTIEMSQDEITKVVTKSQMYACVREAYNDVLENSEKLRIATAKIFAYMIKSDSMPLNSYLSGLEEVLEFANDLMVDIPKLWEYFAELIGPLFIAEALTLKDFHSISSALKSNKIAGNLIAAIFHYLSKEKEPNFVKDLWHKSGLTWENFMLPEDIEKFLKLTNLGYVSGGPVHSANGTIAASSLANIQEKLNLFLKEDAPMKNMVEWITVNVGDGRSNSSEFIRILTTCVCENSIVQKGEVYTLNVNKFEEYYNLLTAYTRQETEKGLQCLYAIQALINRLEHPQGVLLTIFQALSENSVLSMNAFMAWKQADNAAEIEGKGVALKTLVSFFTDLEEADESSTEE